jgi:hypothetical protein
MSKVIFDAKNDRIVRVGSPKNEKDAVKFLDLYNHSYNDIPFIPFFNVSSNASLL